MTVSECVETAVLWIRQQRAQNAPRPWTVIVPSLVPYLPLVVQHVRARVVPPVSVALDGGVPFVALPAWARTQRLIAALETNLLAEPLSGLLPFLRRGEGDAARTPEFWLPRISARRALLLLQATGAHPDSFGPRRWYERVVELVARASEERKVNHRAGARAERRVATVRAQEAERMIRELRPILPALRELDLLADAVMRGGTLVSLCEQYWMFVRKWLLLPMSNATRQAFERTLFARAAVENRHVDGTAFLRWLRQCSATLVVEGENVSEPELIVTAHPVPHGQGPVFVVPRGDDEALFTGTSGWARDVTPVDSLTPERSVGPVGLVAPVRCPGEERASLVGEPEVVAVDPSWLQGWGVQPNRPVSASALTLFLTCPYRFLLERIARLTSPPPRLHTESISAHVFGELVHQTLASCFREFGSEFFRRERELEHWRDRARAVVAEQFEQCLVAYPLWGTAARDRELARLRWSVDQVLAAAWNEAASEFVGAEIRFGEPTGFRIAVSEREIYVRGSVDWLLQVPGGFAVRELKTVRQTLGVLPSGDKRHLLQLGLYVLAVEMGALATSGPVHDAAIVNLTPEGVQRCRLHGAELLRLRDVTRKALAVMATLLEAGVFPRTPVGSDCVRCPFFAHCGEGTAVAAAHKSARWTPVEKEYFSWRKAWSEGWVGAGAERESP